MNPRDRFHWIYNNNFPFQNLQKIKSGLCYQSVLFLIISIPTKIFCSDKVDIIFTEIKFAGGFFGNGFGNRLGNISCYKLIAYLAMIYCPDMDTGNAGIISVKNLKSYFGNLVFFMIGKKSSANLSTGKVIIPASEVAYNFAIGSGNLFFVERSYNYRLHCFLNLLY